MTMHDTGRRSRPRIRQHATIAGGYALCAIVAFVVLLAPPRSAAAQAPDAGLTAEMGTAGIAEEPTDAGLGPVSAFDSLRLDFGLRPGLGTVPGEGTFGAGSFSVGLYVPLAELEFGGWIHLGILSEIGWLMQQPQTYWRPIGTVLELEVPLDPIDPVEPYATFYASLGAAFGFETGPEDGFLLTFTLYHLDLGFRFYAEPFRFTLGLGVQNTTALFVSSMIAIGFLL